MYIGGPCEKSCDIKLHHVYCDPVTSQCSCEKNFPVTIGRTKGCAKGKWNLILLYTSHVPLLHRINQQILLYTAKKLGEQCFYHQTCLHNDPNSMCVQVKHNALCKCATGYHSVTYSKPTKRVFCTQGT